MQKVPVGGQKFNPWTDDFSSNFVGGKNLTSFTTYTEVLTFKGQTAFLKKVFCKLFRDKIVYGLPNKYSTAHV